MRPSQKKIDKDQLFNYSWLKFNICKVVMNKRFSMIDPYEIYVYDFSTKILLDKWAILVPEMMDCENFGSTLKIFLKFCTMKGSRKYIEILSL